MMSGAGTSEIGPIFLASCQTKSTANPFLFTLGEVVRGSDLNFNIIYISLGYSRVKI